MNIYTLNNIDEICAYNNGNSTFRVEIQTADKEGNHMTLTIPNAALELTLNGGYRMESGLEVTLKGLVGR